jgi:hypothetical protein
LRATDSPFCSTQDVTSYVIARTLGDPTASTSHKSSFVTKLPPNSESKIADIDSSVSLTATAVPVPVPVPIAVSPRQVASGIKPNPAPSPTPGTGATPPCTFFVDGEGSEDDGAARLAGVGVFSPVASMPGSPTVSRGDLLEREAEDDGGGSNSSDESGSSPVSPRGVLLRNDGVHHRHHHHHQQQQQQQHRGAGREAETEGGRDGHGHERAGSDGGEVNGGWSTSGESSFAMLDREESFEDAGVHIRRRVPGPAGADE